MCLESCSRVRRGAWKQAQSFLSSQHKCSPWDVPSCPGNVLPGHAASTSLRSPVLLGWASFSPLAKPALRGGTASRWGPAESQEDQDQKARPSSHLYIYFFFWGAQLSAAAAAANSVCGSDARVKNPQYETILDYTKGCWGPIFQLHHWNVARGKGAEAWGNAKLEGCCTHDFFPDRKQLQMPN